MVQKIQSVGMVNPYMDVVSSGSKFNKIFCDTFSEGNRYTSKAVQQWQIQNQWPIQNQWQIQNQCMAMHGVELPFSTMLLWISIFVLLER